MPQTASVFPFSGVFKYSLFFIAIFSTFFVCQAQELPPVAESLESIQSGSYLIPLDLSKQSASYSDLPGGIGYSAINLAAYGLVYRLLENKVPVKWVIRNAKPKDAPDFTANITRLFPSIQAPVSNDFISSAFVIDIGQINAAVCNPLNTDNLPDIENIIAGFGQNVAVYTLNNTMNMNVRYCLYYPPQIAIISNNSNAPAFEQAFNAAHVPVSIINNTDFLSGNGCFTFILQPAANPADNITAAYADAVNNFIAGGGNFWAQSGMAIGLENQTLLMTTAGITPVNNLISPPYIYLANDLPVMQIQGSFPGLVTGTVGTYSLSSGSSWRPFTYPCLTINTPIGANRFVLTGGDLNGVSPGGNLYYCGGDEFTFTTIPSDASTANAVLQAQRLFLNAAFIPAGINSICAGNDICICAGQSTTLGCTTGGFEAGELLWTPNTGLSCTDCPNPIATPEITTTYTVTSTTGQCNLTASVTVTVIQEKPQITNFDRNCNPAKTGFTISFNITGGDPNTYQVEGVGGTLTGNLFTSDIIMNSSPYTIKVSDSYHCETVLTGAFNCQLCYPIATLTGTGGEICLDATPNNLPLNITLTGQSPWQINYAIDGQPQPVLTATSNNFQLPATQSGQYTLIAVEDANCQGITSGMATVTALSAPIISLGPDLTLCNGEAITLNTEIANVEFLWQDGSTEPTLTVSQSGKYWVQASNACGTVSDTVSLLFEKCLPFRCGATVPNAFSPNLDGVNDVFKPIFNCELSKYRLLIFNRWGELIFDTTDPAEGWNGSIINEPMPIGLFVWKLEYQFAEDAGDPVRIAKGNVLLLK